MKPQQSTVQTEEADSISDIKVSQLNADNSGEETKWEPGTHLDEAHCAVDQVSKIRQMLLEECSSFSRDENDLRCAPGLELDIRLKDEMPIKQSYRPVPPPLYPEVKDYILDMVNQVFNRKSSSTYSSPMVCFRKKDSTLRLCIDYRSLHHKSLERCRLIPRTQDSWWQKLVLNTGPR